MLSKQPFTCQYGGILNEVNIAYESWGTLNHNKDNVVLVQHGLSASAHARSHMVGEHLIKLIV